MKMQFSKIAAILTLVAFLGACSQETVPPSAPPLLPSGKVATPEVTLDPESGWEIVSGTKSTVGKITVKGRQVRYSIHKGNKAFSVNRNSGKVKYDGRAITKSSVSITVKATRKPKDGDRETWHKELIPITVQIPESSPEPEVSAQTSSNSNPPTIKKAKARREAITVTWEHVPNAGKYQVRWKSSVATEWSISKESTYKVVGRDEDLSYLIPGLRAGLPYEVGVGTKIGGTGDVQWSPSQVVTPTGLVEVDILIKNGGREYAARWTNYTSWKNYAGVIMVGYKRGINGTSFVQVTHDTMKDTYTGKPKPWPAKDHFLGDWTSVVIDNDNNRYAFPDDSIGTGCHEVEVWAIGPIFGVRSEKIGNTVFGCP